MRVLTRTQRALLARGLVVRVGARFPARLRVTASATTSRRRGKGRRLVIARAVRLPSPARGRTVRLRLTAEGKRLVARCHAHRITVVAHARRLARPTRSVRAPEPRRKPAYKTKRRRLDLDRARCRVQPIPLDRPALPLNPATPAAPLLDPAEPLHTPPPVCADARTARTPYEQPVTVAMRCTGEDLHYQVLVPPRHGKLGRIDPATGRVEYRPDRGYFTPGDPPRPPDRFIYAARNPGGVSKAREARIIVLPEPPTCQDTSATTPRRTAVTMQLPCADEQLEATYEIVRQPEHGTIRSLHPQTGRLVYEPDPAYFSPGDPPVPDTFRYRAFNPAGRSAVATAQVTVLPSPPACDDLSATTSLNVARTLTLPCAHADGEMEIEIVDQPDHGTLGPIAVGSNNVVYTPDENYFGPSNPPAPDTFTYRAANPGGESRVATASIAVYPDPPVCQDVSATARFETPTTIALPCTDVDPAIDYTIVTPPAHGTLGPIDQDAGTVIYTPDDDYVSVGSPDTFTFEATNTGGHSSIHTVRVSVLPPPPSCVGISGDDNYMRPLGLLAQCTGNNLTFSISDPPDHGKVTDLDPNDGTFVYTPDMYFTGTDTLTYTATNEGGSSSGTVTVDVQPYRMRAIGDSLTAGYLYRSDGSEADAEELDDELSCLGTMIRYFTGTRVIIPGWSNIPGGFNGMCSSNSALDDTNSAFEIKPVTYAPDYGLANNVAWPAKVANEAPKGGRLSGTEQYRNLAVSGSTPADWAPAIISGHSPGVLNDTLNAVVTEKPDLVVLTMGATELLRVGFRSESLHALLDHCETSTLSVEQCTTDALFAANVDDYITAVLVALLQSEPTQIVIPYLHNIYSGDLVVTRWYSNVDRAEGIVRGYNALMDAAVQEVAQYVNPDDMQRIHQVAPHRFNWGAPTDWVPDDYRCLEAPLGSVDGESMMDSSTQLSLGVRYPLHFCAGTVPALGGDSANLTADVGHEIYADALRSAGVIPPLPN